MKYAASNVIGDAGEYYFAFSITHTLGWPCRLLDIDIGIDAQIEILDDHYHSSGHFLAVQIKSTVDGEKLSLAVEKKHVDYWLSVDVPVLLALVNVDSQKVYLKSIRVEGDVPLPNAKGGNYRFDFTSSDLLSKSRMEDLRLLAYAPEVKRIKKILETTLTKCLEIIDDCDLENGVKVEEFEHYLDFISDMQDVGSDLYKCKEWVLRVRSQVGDCGYTDAVRLFKKTRDEMSSFFSRTGYEIHNSAELKAFKDEYFARDSRLDLDD